MDLDATTECNMSHSVLFEAEISLSEVSEISLQQIPESGRVLTSESEISLLSELHSNVESLQ